MPLKPIVCAAPRCNRRGVPFAPRRRTQRTCSPACRMRLSRSENTGRRPLKSHKHAVVVHGARSPEHVAIRAREIHARITDVAPWIKEDRYLPALARYLNAAAKESLLDDYIDRVVADKGVEAIPMKVFEALNASRRIAWQMSAELGLTPKGYGALKKLNLEGESVEYTLQRLIDTSPPRPTYDIEVEVTDDTDD
jgi:hypothetical protein